MSTDTIASPSRTTIAVWVHDTLKALSVVGDGIAGSVRVPDGEAREAAAEAIRSGAPIDEIFNGSGWTIDVSEPAEIYFDDRGAADIVFERRRREGHDEIELKVLPFESPIQRDEAFAMIERATVETHERNHRKGGGWISRLLGRARIVRLSRR